MQQPTATHSSTPPNAFTVHVSGVLESCTSAHPGALFATLFLLVGQHWQGFNIQLQMVTQLVAPTHDPGPPIVTWSYPFSASWYTSSASGWPQLLVSVYGVDSARAGGDVLVGYAHVLLPRHAGTHSVCAPMFVPEAAASCTCVGKWLRRVVGRAAREVPDLGRVFGNGASNRQAWQVRSQGVVKLTLTVHVQDVDKAGYEFGQGGATSDIGVAGMCMKSAIAGA